jgi:ataxia telangiectasia mutated family protein
MRQDAVMMQVFATVNNLLEGDTHTRTRQLRIRTYVVVPLSSTAGVLEWVENTQVGAEAAADV